MLFFAFFVGFGGVRQTISEGLFRGKNSGVFRQWSGLKTAAVSTKQKTLRCTRLLCADGQVGGGAAVEYPVAAAARLS